VVGLAGVDHVDQPLGVQVPDPVPQRHEVGRGVPVTAVPLTDDHRRTEAVDEDAEGAVVDDRETIALQVVDHLGEVCVVGRLPRQVLIHQQHVQPRIRRVEAGKGDLDQVVPHRQGRLVTGLQGHHAPTGPVGELLVGPEVRAGSGVQRLGLGQRQPPGLDPLLGDLLHQHAELGAPVPHVVMGDHLVSDPGQHPAQAVTDHGGPQVADVHLLGHVGGRIVDHHDLRLGDPHHPDVRVGKLLGDGVGEHRGLQPEVDESWAGDLGRLGKIRQLQPGHDLRRDLAGRLPLGLGEPKGDVGLEVSELRLGRRAQLRVNPGYGFDPGSEQGGQRRHNQ
jgi:hypothetical protein